MKKNNECESKIESGAISPYLRIREAAKFLNTSVSTIRRLLDARKIKGKKMCDNTLILRDSIIEYMDNLQDYEPSNKKRNTESESKYI